MIKIKIMGRIWKVDVLEGDAFHKKFEGDEAGVTIPSRQEIFLNEDDLSLSLVVHELGHAYLDCCCVHAAELDKNQHEEVFCELLATYGEILFKQAREIFKVFKRTR